MRHRGTDWLAACVAAAGLTAAACGGASATGGSSPVTGSSAASSTASSSSHNAGRNCLSCHAFGAAGTVYRTGGTSANTAASVRLTTAPDGGGTVVATLRSDGSGNFYTQQPVAYGPGLYADVAGSSGTRSFMKAALTSGGCNGCHGSSTARLIAD